MSQNTFNTRATFDTPKGNANIYKLSQLEKDGIGNISRLPFSIRVLLESMLRNEDGFAITAEHITAMAQWNAKSPGGAEIPFKPARVLLQDFTGVPTIVDMAALRSAMQRAGGDPALIQPQVPVDLVIDHSVQVDNFAMPDALQLNADIEFARNRERYEFLHWARNSFDNFRVVPPATGIVHQVNLEYLAPVVATRQRNGATEAFPDSVVGTDSHTPMINGVGVVGWGVGGIEAEAVMLDQPIFMLMPEVVGFKLTGALPEGATATDLVLTVTQMLRAKGVVGKFVEYFGPGLDHMAVPDRATLSNMSPEYGATMGLFPIDAQTLTYLRLTGRGDEQVALVEAYAREQGFFRTSDTPDPEFTDTLELDMGTVQPSMAGPKRPQDRILLTDMKDTFHSILTSPVGPQGLGIPEENLKTTATVSDNGDSYEIGHGAVVIAAITSCTNTSNPSVMIAAGLLAKKAAEAGLTRKPWVKSSLAPGSKVVTSYLEESELMPYLEELGFHVVGYGCTTCIGNSGPVPENVAQAVTEHHLVASAVLSGNRNFEGRISPIVQANFLASPPLVVAYALAGTTDIDLTNDPLGTGKDGQAVYLKDIWPTQEEIGELVAGRVKPEHYAQRYADVFDGNPTWNAISGVHDLVYPWDAGSTYLQEPPYFEGLTVDVPPVEEIHGARVLALLGNSITTDHISPAGAIAKNSPAGRYLLEHGVEIKDFNSYGSRRGNDHIVTRGGFANIRIKNQLLDGKEGGFTIYFPTGEEMFIFDAAMKYKDDGTPLVVLAGKEYGSGSSRDQAAKAPLILGVKAVIAESYERIHRSNLIFMGLLPLQFKEGDSWQSLGLTGRETFDIEGLDDDLQPLQELTVKATAEDGSLKTFNVVTRIDTPVEVRYYRNGGILHTVLRDLLRESAG